MAVRIFSSMERLLDRIRYVLILSCFTSVCVLVMTQPANAQFCSSNTCGFGSQDCTPTGDFCEHIKDYHAYWDPTCSWSYCCVGGPCYVKNNIEGTGCYYCHSGDAFACGYGAGC